MTRQSFVLRAVCTLALMLGLPAITAAQGEPFIGEIRWVPYTFAPRGWADCDGRLLPIAQNQALFSLIGTDYGGDGQVTFALPDMRGRVPLNVGQGPGLTNRKIGESSGSETHALTIDELPAHSHATTNHTHAIPALALDLKATSAAATSATAAGNVLATVASQGNQKAATRIYAGGTADVSLGASGTTAPAATGSGGGGSATRTAGGDAAHPNMPPFLGVRCIIAMQGIYPLRP